MYSDVILPRAVPPARTASRRGPHDRRAPCCPGRRRGEGYSVELFDMTGNTVTVVTLPASALRLPTTADRPAVPALLCLNLPAGSLRQPQAVHGAPSAPELVPTRARWGPIPAPCMPLCWTPRVVIRPFPRCTRIDGSDGNCQHPTRECPLARTSAGHDLMRAKRSALEETSSRRP